MDKYSVVFAADETLAVATGKSGGSGTWSVTAADRFEFTFREVFNADVTQISPTGRRAAYIKIDIAAQRSGDTFTGTGKAVVHAHDDTVIYATDAETTARRVS
ncbi:dehydrogenase [Streptomyces monticola]|uniref:Dehydrogenase n=1 Tax=Streptomyces monticola TaxID=2666263 RepID=A0ABW2JXE5_9ACTN